MIRPEKEQNVEVDWILRPEEKRGLYSRKVKESTIFEKLVSSSQKHVALPLLIFVETANRCQLLSFFINVCMKDNDHRKMSTVVRLEYYAVNKRND
jgi:hypothetical protein